jgi:formylglycine-generating enzyme required for sulfatase activity
MARATLLPLALLALAACRDPTPAPPAASAAGSGAVASGTPPALAAPPSSGAPSSSSATLTAPAPCASGRILIPAGTFRMGALPDEKDASPQERPARDVTVRAFCIDRTEVTVAAFARCASAAACAPASAVVVSSNLSAEDVAFWSKFCNAGYPDRAEHPVNCVDWKQASAYCAWAGGRLPTEAEWEYAARGTDGRRYPWGNEPPSATRLNGCGRECGARGMALGRPGKKTMYDGDDGAETTAPVGRYPEGQSPFGVLDLAGNVWEWTADGYAPYDPTQTDNPSRDGGGPARAVRGGHWLNTNPATPRAAHREPRHQDKRLEDVGFRCVAAPGAVP